MRRYFTNRLTSIFKKTYATGGSHRVFEVDGLPPSTSLRSVAATLPLRDKLCKEFCFHYIHKILRFAQDDIQKGWHAQVITITGIARLSMLFLSEQ